MIRHKRFFIGAVSLLGLCGLFSFTIFQDDLLEKIKQQLEKWTKDQPVEKVYLQMDKPYYAAGEDIWFKAYVVSGSGHRLSGISNIVNIDLLDPRGHVCMSEKLHLDSGMANGDFALPDTLSQGNYRVRAYTQYMRNAGSDYYFKAIIQIINNVNQLKTKEPNHVAEEKTGKIDLQFFPEGGSLVNGIRTIVAFKAVAPGGLGIQIKGIVTDDHGRQVAIISSAHLGMGTFGLTPVEGTVYKAIINESNGSVDTVFLPKATNQGYVLNVDPSGHQNLQIKITASQQLLQQSAGQQLILIAQSAGKIYDSRIVQPGATFISISKDKFPSGIVQFTLFTPGGEPLNERLVFIQRADQLNLNIAKDKQVYTPRQKVKLTLSAKDADNNSVQGHFSVSVTDETRVPADEDSENNIMADLLLTSDLKGNIEQPAYYFNKPDAKKESDLDVLMLTQGYHRFEWKKLAAGDVAAQRYLPEKHLRVSGTVLTPGGKPVVNGTVKLFDLDSIQYTRDTITDEQGRFEFNNLSFNDSVRFIVQARTSKNKRGVDIKMDPSLPEMPEPYKHQATLDKPSFTYPDVYAKSSRQYYLVQLAAGQGNHIIPLEEVMIREKKELLRFSSNLNGPGNADQIVLGKTLRDLACIRITDCLEGRLTGVIFNGGVPYSTRGFGPMQLIVDGSYVEGSDLNTLNYNDIEGIEVLRSGSLTAIYGGFGGNGVIVVTTRHGGDDDEPLPIYGRGITTYYPKGYYKAREFYAPRYDNPKENKQLADLRTTIYWNPNLVTNNSGITTFDFFNAGSKGTYRVVVEGIDNDGHLGRTVYHYQVQ